MPYIRVFVWYPTGVKKLKLAANITASKKGLKSSCSPCATEIAIGVIMMAVALLLTTPLMSMVTKNRVPVIIQFGLPDKKSKSCPEIHISAPVLFMATPKGIIPANKKKDLPVDFFVNRDQV